MNTVQQEFDRLLTEVSVFFKHQQEIYGDIVYTDYNFDNFVLTLVEIKNQQLIKFSEQIKNCQNCSFAISLICLSQNSLSTQMSSSLYQVSLKLKGIRLT